MIQVYAKALQTKQNDKVIRLRICERIKPTSYVALENNSDEFLDDLIENGEILLSNGSYVSDGRFHLGC